VKRWRRGSESSSDQSWYPGTFSERHHAAYPANSRRVAMSLGTGASAGYCLFLLIFNISSNLH
jgi:hypothetical protein